MTAEEILKLFDLKFVDSPIFPGDMYIAQRNQTQLLICKEIKDGMLIPTNLEYPYNINECKKVIEIND